MTVMLADVPGMRYIVFDYLAEPNAGVLEFLFVGAKHRGGGFGAQLLAAVIRVLEADAARRGAPLTAIVAEMNDPFQPGATPDNLVHQDVVYAKLSPISVSRADLVEATGGRIPIIEDGAYVLW